jgi:RES domain
MKSPKTTEIQVTDTHRLIPFRYSDKGKPILNLIANDDSQLLNDLTELERATNDRLLGESGKLPGINMIELVSGFRLAHIVNASFTHANPRGGRFNGPDRGAWYAAFKREVAEAEVVYHKSQELKEISWYDEEPAPYVDYLADLHYEFHDIQNDAEFTDCLDPNSWVASQGLAARLLNTGSAGIVYPSPRHPNGICIACFRPPLVQNVREGQKLSFIFVNAEAVERRIED